MAQSSCRGQNGVEEEEEEDSDSDSECGAESLMSDEEEEESSAEQTDAETEERLSPSPSPPASPTSAPMKRARVCGPQQSGWMGAEDKDPGPKTKMFIPKRKPGPQLRGPGRDYSPLELFSLFIDRSAVSTLCDNINKLAARNIAKGRKYIWTKLNETEFYKFLGLTFYISLVKLQSVPAYWKKNTIFSQAFPQKVMCRDRFRNIAWTLHMSDPDETTANDKKKGTAEYDGLFRLRPLLDSLTAACKSNYHPRQSISVYERTVVPKARTGMNQYIKRKPSKWGFRLFVLADSDSGYTVDFSIYTGKSKCASGHGLAYDCVMSLIEPLYLGAGYHLYVDNYFTSTKLFRDLHHMDIGACGTYRPDRRDCPQTQTNALSPKSERGELRWIREGPLLFVKWMDRREVCVCSTIHPAFTGETVMRRVRADDGSCVTEAVLCPAAVIEHNKHMRGEDQCDQLLQYHSVHKTTVRWYRALFYHFVDIAATNAHILHKELCRQKQQTPMSLQGFLEELTAQLCGVTVTLSRPCATVSEQHLPVPLRPNQEKSKGTSYGRRTCVHCWGVRQKRQATPWKCQACDVALCLVYDRNCFYEWHQ